MARKITFSLVWGRIFGIPVLLSFRALPDETPDETPPEESLWQVQETWQACVDPELTEPLAYLGELTQI